MAKSKSKRRQKKAEPEQVPTFAHWRLVGAAGFVALAAASGWWWQGQSEQQNAFEDQARRGRAALDQVVLHANEGRGHLGLGESVRYESNPPTSGIHNSNWIDPGVYTRVQAREKLVHSLEHGMVVIYYDKPTVPVAEALDHWAGQFGAPWSGVVVAPKPGLGETIILAAWRRTLTLDPFDGDAGAAFIDAYRGRGPEHPVR
jgi:hypothetical protein